MEYHYDNNTKILLYYTLVGLYYVLIAGSNIWHFHYLFMFCVLICLLSDLETFLSYWIHKILILGDFSVPDLAEMNWNIAK